jgi:hypothetical protein
MSRLGRDRFGSPYKQYPGGVFIVAIPRVDRAVLLFVWREEKIRRGKGKERAEEAMRAFEGESGGTYRTSYAKARAL